MSGFQPGVSHLLGLDNEPPLVPGEPGTWLAEAAYDRIRIDRTSRGMWKPSRPPYWLIARPGRGGTELLTIGGAGKVSMLALFGSEEGAIEFCRWYTKGSGWRARPIGNMELLTILRGSSPEAGYVALDPSPELVVEDAIDLVSLSREGFVDSLLGRGRAWFEDREKGGAHG